jgi:preprotein translocase subunit SecG
MQKPRQEGLGASFGGGIMDSLAGAQTTNVLQRGTVYFGIALFVLTFLLAILTSRMDTHNAKTTLVNPSDIKAKPEAVQPGAPLVPPATDNKTATPAPTAPATTTPAPAAPAANAPAKPAETKPAAPEAKPAPAPAPAPANTKPADTKPAEPAKPSAESKPADKTPAPPTPPVPPTPANK